MLPHHPRCGIQHRIQCLSAEPKINSLRQEGGMVGYLAEKGAKAAGRNVAAARSAPVWSQGTPVGKSARALFITQRKACSAPGQAGTRNNRYYETCNVW